MTSFVCSTIMILCFLISVSAAGCPQAKNMASYSQSLLKAIRPTSAFAGTINLPTRYIAGVHLYRGQLSGFDVMELIEDPPKLYCLNSTMAALQTKFKASNISSGYEFGFTAIPEVRGIMSLPKQDFFIDIDVEKDSNKNPELLGLYLTQPIEEFKIDVTKGSDHKDIKKVLFHVETITKMVFSRDVRTAILTDFTPRIESFLTNHDIDISS